MQFVYYKGFEMSCQWPSVAILKRYLTGHISETNNVFIIQQSS